MDVIIAPEECRKLVRVTLPNPRDGKPQHFLHDDENMALYEIIKFSDKYRSWLVDDLLCSEGHFSMLTRIDPLYIFVRVLSLDARDQFRPLHDVCQEFSTEKREFNPLDCALSPNIHWPSVCDTREIDGDLYVKFNENKTLDWLSKKHERLMDKLKLELGDSSKVTLMSHASELLSDYVPDVISEKLKKRVKDKHTR